jgi:hypothetical protein
MRPIEGEGVREVHGVGESVVGPASACHRALRCVRTIYPEVEEGRGHWCEENSKFRGSSIKL